MSNAGHCQRLFANGTSKEYVQLRLSKCKLFQYLALQLPPFRTPFCIDRASHYCHPAANLGNFYSYRFLCIAWRFQPQRANCRKPPAVETMDKSAKHIQKITNSEIKDDSNEQSEDKAAECPLLNGQSRRLGKPRDQTCHSMQQISLLS